MQKIILRCKLLVAICVALVLRFIFFFIPDKDYWVIMERGVEARDNAYFFYKYMKDNHPDKKVYYIIDKKSADYHKVKEDAVQFNSLKFLFLAFTCEKIISTHYNDIVSNLYRFKKCMGLYKKYCFLQHGITHNFTPFVCADESPMQIFVCGAKPEYEYILNNYGHSADVVKYTGFARFDNLHDICVKRQIVVMPTWRKNYNGEFKESDYFKNWNEFLQDKKLAEFLEETDITLFFYPHFEVQKYLQLFGVKSKNIVMASLSDYDVQTLLKESALLITDYSSVVFDFAYMKKPVIYFQFDKEDFFKSHYEKGYFDYESMGFGKVLTGVSDLVDETVRIAKNDFAIDSHYLKRTEAFFPLYDTKNCERIYNEIIKTR